MQHSETVTAKSRIPSLDGLRGISILLVLFGHVAGTRNAFSESVFRQVGDLSNLGVRIFFVISGFLITSLLLAEYKETGAISLKHFYRRRILRIFPAFFAFLMIVGMLDFVGVLHVDHVDFLTASTFSINFHTRGWNLGHFWSLAIEEQFYLLWPMSMALLGIRRSLGIALLTMLISPLLRVVCAMKHFSDLGQFYLYADSLVCGCLLAMLRTRLHRNALHLAFLESKCMLVCPGLALVLNASHGFGFHTLFISSITIAIAILIDSVTSFPTKTAAILNWKPLALLGTFSYSIYVWQQIFLNRYAHSTFTSFPINLVLALACGIASYYLIERPFLKLKGRLDNKQRLFGNTVQPIPLPETA